MVAKHSAGVKRVKQNVARIFTLPIFRQTIPTKPVYKAPVNIPALPTGFRSLDKALGMEPEAIVREIEQARLSGRGGAGFDTAQKWRACREIEGKQKYLICNADEGDPGAFMDRVVLESDPHAVIEGMVIAAHAIGTTQGFIYTRAEYPLVIERLRGALSQAREIGVLGDAILGSGLTFDIELVEGAGAFVCGESSAMIYSIEGKRPMPRVRPPRSVERGLWQRPTVVNNVKTFALVSRIIEQGGEWFSRIGTTSSTGTAVGNDGTILRTTDGGANWTIKSSGTGTTLQAVSFTDANTGTVVGFPGIILHTTDGGDTWTNQISGTSTQLSGVSFTDANTGTVVGSAGTILRTATGGIIGIEELHIYDTTIPKDYILHQNYPNPFNPSTIIKFSLPKPENVNIEVFNIIGQKIETLLNKPMPAGHHKVEFNGQNLSSGIYLYIIEVVDPARRTGEWQDVRKMLLVK